MFAVRGHKIKVADSELEAIWDFFSHAYTPTTNRADGVAWPTPGAHKFVELPKYCRDWYTTRPNFDGDEIQFRLKTNEDHT